VENLTPEMVVGLVVVFGVAFVAILMMLKRLGIIKFSNGEHCADHDAFCEAFKNLKHEHIIHGEMLKVHTSGLSEGKEIVKEIKNNIEQINLNIALLVEKSKHRRSGDYVGSRVDDKS